MLGVIGVAGAYGMAERLSAQSLSTALTSLQIKLTPMTDSAGPIVDRAMTMAASVAPKPRSIAIESDDEVILQVPRFALASATPMQIVEPSRMQAIAAPITRPPTCRCRCHRHAAGRAGRTARRCSCCDATPERPLTAQSELPKTEPLKTEPRRSTEPLRLNSRRRAGDDHRSAASASCCGSLGADDAGCHAGCGE